MPASPTSDGRAPGGRIEAECLRCGRRGTLDGDDARVEGIALVTLTRRLVCSACGSRAVKAESVRTPREIAMRLRRPGSSAGPGEPVPISGRPRPRGG